ncbi:T9SS type A sorting domain-containing protein, partial [bacterium]|nr:T9SS type A sorting domain-containing protein [bacterium]
QEELARKAAEAAAWETPGELESLWQNVLAAKRSGNLDAFKQAITAYDDAVERLGRPGSGTLDACDDCLTPNTALGVIGTTAWYTVNGDFTSEGKWYASFTGEVGATYHWDLCDPGSATDDVDIKVSDASCTVLAGIDGSSSCGWNPVDWTWTCATAGIYYIEVCPYHYPQTAHYCDETSTITFTLAYYKEEPPTAFACCYDDHGVNVCAEVADEDACDLLGGTFYPGLGCDDVWCCNPTQPGQTDVFTFTPTTAYAADLTDETGCLGYYDNGNDDIVPWTVSHEGWYEITITSDDNYPGIAVTYDCEALNCIVFATGGSAYTTTTACTFFAAGDYYIFVGNWSETPTTFTLSAAVCTAPPIGRCCYGDVFAPSCDDMTEAACLALTDDISWDELLNCHDNPCEPAVAGRCCYGSDPFAPLCIIETETACLNRYNDISWTAGITDCELYPCEPPVCDEPAGAVADECVNAIPVGTLPAHYVGITTSTMSAAPTTPSCGTMNGPAVWYSVVGTGNTLTAATCDLCTDPTFDTVIRVYACDCDNLICVGNADGGCAYTPGSHSSFSWCSEAGEVYLIAVGGYFASDYGYFILDVTDDGEACTGAIVCPESGACCYNDGADCVTTTEEECLNTYGGDYFAGEDCATFVCPTPCPFPSLDVEPNNTCQEAQTVTCGSYCGELTPYGDVDWYKLVITAPDCQEVTISIFGDDTPGMWPQGKGLDPWVGFYADDCTTLLFSQEDNYGPPGPSVYDCWIEDTGCLAAGTYYIAIEHNYGSGGPYIMEIACTPCTCPSQLDCHDFVLCGTPVEAEPNDACLAPDQTQLTCGSTIYGVICEFDEHDFFEILVPAMTTIEITLKDGEGCTEYPTACILNDLLWDDCTVAGSGNSAGWYYINDTDAPVVFYLDVYGTTDMCVSTYSIDVVCCEIVDGCSGSGQIYVEVIDGYYSYLGNTCCNTNEVMTIADECTGYPYGSGPDAIFEMDLLEDSYIDRILLTMTGDCQFMIFTDCADPEGTCVAAADALVGATEELLALSLPAGQYYLSVSLYSSLGTACGPFLLEIWSDFPLPVELVNFDAIASDRSVTLNWATASETNNDRFDVFANGELRGTVDAKNLAIGGEYSFTDAGLTNGTTYDYSVKSVSLNGEVEELFTISATPSFAAATITEYALHQNFPNPFNPETKITFDMVDAGFVNLTVYNLLGQQVATLVNGTMDAGRHIVSFEAGSLPSGLYLYRMETDGFSAQKKMILMK